MPVISNPLNKIDPSCGALTKFPHNPKLILKSNLANLPPQYLLHSRKLRLPPHLKLKLTPFVLYLDHRYLALGLVGFEGDVVFEGDHFVWLFQVFQGC